MELTTTYKKVLAVMILLLAGFMSQAQHSVVVGSTRTFRVADVAASGHVYQWEVIDKDGVAQALLFEDGAYTIGKGSKTTVGSIDPTQTDSNKFFEISFKCPTTVGNYTLRMTEANAQGCITENEIPVSVVASPLKFTLDKTADYDVVFNDVDRRKITIPITFTDIESSVWSNSYYERHNENGQYTVSIKYKFYTDEGVKGTSHTIEKEVYNTEDLLYLCKEDFYNDFGNELIENENDKSDRYFEFEIVGVKDRYGADVAVEGENKFIFGIYKKAHITKINHK